jgi:very-short-patch-repair endonuclease
MHRTYWNTKTFSDKIHSENPNIEVIGEYINAHTKIKCVCLLDGHIWYPTPTHLLHTGRGCPKCNGGVKKTHEEFVKQVKTINPNIKVVGRYIRDSEKIEFECIIDKHRWKTKPTHIIQGHGCPKCNTSIGEKTVAKVLKGMGIKFIQQFRFKNCKDKHTLPFDFYVPELNLCIEYDGEQHFRQNPEWGGMAELIEVKKRDGIKNAYCIENGVMLIRVPYFVKNIEQYLVERIFQRPC